jgi:hypothetical protein
LEFYRPRLLGRVVAAWLVASGLLCVGVVTLALVWDSTGKLPDDWKGIALGCGVGTTVTGAVGGIFGILRILSADDSYLLVRGAGLEVSSDSGDPTFLPWKTIEAIVVEQGQLVLQVQEGAPLAVGRAFQGIRLAALADRLSEIRRKALLGALRIPPPRRPQGW